MIKMIKLEKNFIGKICELCDELEPNTLETKDKYGNRIIFVGCSNSYKCKNELKEELR